MADEKLIGAIQEMANKLGVEIEFGSDPELKGYRRGDLMTMGELRALEDDSVVWLYIYYKESVRANHAFHIVREGDCWILSDGSSFGADFEDTGGADSDPAVDEWSKIFKAVKV